MPFLFNFGSSQFRRWVVERIPFEFIQKPRRIVDLIDHETRTILETKKRALEQGDKAVLEQVGEGRDILSTLCECHLLVSIERVVLTCIEKVRANMAASDEDKISDEEVMAHISYAPAILGPK